MNGDDLHAARERNGAAAADRPSEVDEIMSDAEKVGFRTELPLLDRDYSEYPRGDDLYRPAEGDALRTLAEHDRVGSAEDVAEELGTDVGTVKQAADLHNVELPDGPDFKIRVDTNRLDQLLRDYPEDMLSHSNALTVATLYVDRGLSISEIADVFEEADDGNVNERRIRQSLIDVGALPGTTTDEQKHRERQNYGELTRPRGGISVDATSL